MVEQPSVFSDRLGRTADFNSNEFHDTKVRVNIKASLPVCYVYDTPGPVNSDKSDAEDSLWDTVPSGYETRVPAAVRERKVCFDGRSESAARARASGNRLPPLAPGSPPDNSALAIRPLQVSYLILLAASRLR